MLRLVLIDEMAAAGSIERIVPRLENVQFTLASGDRLPAATAFDGVVYLSHRSPQKRLVLDLLAAGKHLLIDAPLARSLDKGREIAEAARQSKARLMMGIADRFLPSIKTIKECLDAGKLGAPGLVRIHRWVSANDPRRSAVEQWNADVELTCWLFSARPELVFAIGQISADDPDSWAHLQLHLGFAGGGMALVDFARSLPQGDGYYSVSLIGSTGAAYSDDHQNMQLLYHGGRPEALKTEQGDRARLAQLQEFVAAITSSREPMSTVADAVRTLEVIDAARAALINRQAVHFTAATDSSAGVREAAT